MVQQPLLSSGKIRQFHFAAVSFQPSAFGYRENQMEATSFVWDSAARTLLIASYCQVECVDFDDALHLDSAVKLSRFTVNFLPLSQ